MSTTSLALAATAIAAGELIVEAERLVWPRPFSSEFPTELWLLALVLVALCALLACERQFYKTAALLAGANTFYLASTIAGWVLYLPPPFGYIPDRQQADNSVWFPNGVDTSAFTLLAVCSATVLALASAPPRFRSVSAPWAWATGLLTTCASPIIAVAAFQSSNEASRAMLASLGLVGFVSGFALMRTQLVRQTAMDARSRSLAVAATAIVCGTMALWYGTRVTEIRQLNSELHVATDSAVYTLQKGMDTMARSANRLFKDWAVEWPLSDPTFLSDASEYMRDSIALAAIVVTDAQGRIVHAARRAPPFGSAHAATDSIVQAGDIANQLGLGGEYFRAVALRTLNAIELVRPPLIRLSNEIAFDNSASPIVDPQGRKIGVVIFVFRRELVVMNLMETIAPEYSLDVRIDGASRYRRSAVDGEPRLARQFQQRHEFTRNGYRYEVLVAPGRRAVDRNLTYVPFFVLAFAWTTLGLAGFAWFNERRARALFEDRERTLNQSPDIIGSVNLKGAITAVNAAIQRVLGYTQDEVIGRSLEELTHPDDRELLQTLAINKTGERQATTPTIRAIGKSGQTVHLQGSVLWSPADQLYYCDLRDVTQQHLLALQHQDIENVFHSGVALAGCAVYELNPSSGRMRWVGAVKALTGYEPEQLEAIGFHGWARNIHPEDAVLAQQLLRQSMDARRAHAVEYRLNRGDGGVTPVLDRGRPLVDPVTHDMRLIGVLIDLTVIRKQEEELRASEERYRIVATQTGAVVGEYNCITRAIRVWGAVEQIFGYSKEEWEARTFHEFSESIHSDDREKVTLIVEQAERAVSSFYVEYRHLHRDGGYRYLATRGVYVPGPDGRAARSFTTITDVTDRKHAERALEANQKRFQLAAEQARQMVYEWQYDNHGNIVDVQFAGAFEQVLGYSPSEFHDMLLNQRFNLIHQEDGETIRKLNITRVGGPDHFTMEFRVKHRDGHFLPMESVGAVRRDAEGRIVSMLGMMIDISTRKMAEEERLRHMQQLHMLAEVARRAGAILSLPELLDLLANSARTLVGAKAATATLPARDYAGSTQLIAQARLNGQEQEPSQSDEAATLNAPLLGRDGRNIGVIETSGKLAGQFTEADVQVLNQLAGLASMTVENIELYNTLEQRVAARTHDLEVSNRELEAFSYSVSHDLRAPLRAIAGFSNLLDQEYGQQLTGEARRYLQRIVKGVEHMATLIDDLLSLARVSRADLKRENVDVTNLAHAIVRRINERHGNPQLNISIDPKLSADADPRLLEVALENLIDNAIKFSAPRGAPKIRIGSRTVDNARAFFVSDNGVGFDPQYAENLFGLFQRMHSVNEFPGTGVGLATVHRIVQRHGGRVWAESALNQGATFFFTLAI